jgi:hypothetical protein
MGGATLSIGPHPDLAGKYAVVMAIDNEPVPMATFNDQDDALQVMDFLDAAFRQSALALRRMAGILEGG